MSFIRDIAQGFKEGASKPTGQTSWKEVLLGSAVLIGGSLVVWWITG